MADVVISKRTCVTHTIGYDGHCFNVEFQPTDASDVLVKIEGDKATVGYLVNDEDAGEYYFADPECNGRYINFDRHTIHGRDRMGTEEMEELIRENPGRVFWVNKFEHGMVEYSRASEALVSAGDTPDHGDQWDTSRGIALFVAPDDCPDPAKYCDSTMEAFTNWCNGDIYGVATQEFTLKPDGEWEPGESEESWRHIGHKWAKQALREEMGLPAEEAVDESR